MGTNSWTMPWVNPWLKLVKLNFKLDSLGYESRVVCPPFDAMMERKRERYSLLTGVKNSPQELGLDPEQVKKEIKELEEFIQFNSETLRFWHSSEDQVEELCKKWDLEKLSETDDKQKIQAFLNNIPDKKELAQTLKNMIKTQHGIMKKLQASLLADDVARVDRDRWDSNFYLNKTFKGRWWNRREVFTGWRSSQW